MKKSRVFPIAHNDSEAVLFRFFDPLRHPIEDWDVIADGVNVEQMFHSVRISWLGTAPVGVSLEREVEIDTEGYDHLAVCIEALTSSEISIRATVDGESRTIIEAHGNNAGIEPEGELRGRFISSLRIEIHDIGDSPGQMNLFFLGLFDRNRREKMRSCELPYPDDWADLLVSTNGGIADTQPQLNLLFGGEDLPRLRERVTGPTWGPVYEKLRATAKSYLGSEPWLGIGHTVNNFPVRNGHRGDGVNADYNWIDISAMRLCAFVGLLDSDEELMRTALHHALAVAHCDVWTTGFMSTMPGSSWDIRCFAEYRNAINVIFAWDWAGSMLTDAGKELLAQAVSMKGFPRIAQTLMRHPYVRGNNQGIFFAFGGIVVSAALGHHWPFGDDFIEPFRSALDETVDAYYAPDGGTYEGVGYATGALEQALAGYAVYARFVGADLKDIVPASAINSVDYISAMLSTEEPIGAVIKHSDGGRAGACVRPGALGILCELSHDPAVPALLAGLNRNEYEPNYTPENELNIIFGPDELPASGARPPVFRNLDQTGLLCSTRTTDEGASVRVQFIGGPAGAGHGHDDRGSFVLEAYGEELAVDRGQMPYLDPRSSTIKFARYHNLAVPQVDSDPMRQHNPCPVDSIAQGSGDSRRLRVTMNLDGVWPNPVTRCGREIVSENCVEELTIVDRISSSTPITVGFYLHSRYPWERTNEGWSTHGALGRLHVKPEWQPVTESGEIDFILGTKEPAYRLLLTTPEARDHELSTLLSVGPI